ncbi:AcrR family transcriptional regulator [Allocatelliglobosispora scoriae]|uniref:AcrR family transcriptional regulator n=1 Tax=Allocatelliglobosispora scoriae TaxID=643052 RepID=A0A841BP33_9ACTN|nr:TetR/AcrR family transcriptional regulator [Allocatelliglobosispora scoriae]MBB5869066.1 AcrR family transcriptional regulator [Allocatelliglobosispora scoriae]
MTRFAEFQRARSEEQREVRRQAILDTAAAMLAEMPVADLSLNELSRRVGLAKSNVLRYFETREAVLLDLFDTAWRGWLARLGTELPAAIDPAAPVAERYVQVADVLTASLVADPLLCELMSVSAGVLERNISPEVAKRYKLGAIANTETLTALTRACLPELGAKGGFHFAAGVLLSTGGLWPLTNPTDAMLCVYEDPAMAAMRLDFRTALHEMLATLLIGCLTRWPAE